MVSADTVSSHRVCAGYSQRAVNVVRGLPNCVYAALRRGSSDWGAIHRAAGPIPLSLRYGRHSPAPAHSRGRTHLVAASGLFHIPCVVLRFLLYFPAQIVPFSLDLAGERTSSFFPVAHRRLCLRHIYGSLGRVLRFGLGSTLRWQSHFCIRERWVGCTDCELPTVG
jgi:hypothetical protein